MDGMKLGELLKKLAAAMEIAGEDATVLVYPDSQSGLSYNNRVKGLNSISVASNGSPGSVSISFYGPR